MMKAKRKPYDRVRDCFSKLPLTPSGPNSPKLPNNPLWCKFCFTPFNGSNIVSLRTHILRTCFSVPLPIKTQFSPPGESSVGQSKVQTESVSVSAPLLNSDGNINQFIPVVSKSAMDQIHQQLFRAIATSGVAFSSIVENPEWRRYHELIGYPLPTRRLLSNKCLDSDFELCKTEMAETLAKADNVSISTDIWTDVNGISILNFIVHIDCQPHIYKYVNLGSDSHTAEVLSEHMCAVIEEIGPNKVTCIVSDNAANCIAAWKKVKERFPWVISYGCLAHSLNLLSLGTTDLLTPFFQQTSHILDFFARSAPNALLKAAKVSLVRHIQTRWSSHFYELESIWNNRDTLKTILISKELEEHQNASRQFAEKMDEVYQLLMNNQPFWDCMKSAMSLLKPIVDGISVVESDSFSLGEFSKLWKSLMEQLKNRIRLANVSKKQEKQFKKDLQMRSEKHFNHGSQYAAAILHPMIRRECLTDEEDRIGREFIVEFVSKHPHFKGTSEAVKNAITAFVGRIHPYDVAANLMVDGSSLKAADWWKGNHFDSPLRSVAIRILSMPCSSAASERNWSVRGFIHSNVRNRLLTERVDKLVMVRQWLIQKRPKKSEKIVTTVEQSGEEFDGFGTQDDVEVIADDAEWFGDRLEEQNDNETASGSPDVVDIPDAIEYQPGESEAIGHQPAETDQIGDEEYQIDQDTYDILTNDDF